MRHPPFQPGNPGGGRPKGSRNRLCKQVLDDLLADWAEGGAAAIKIMRIERPSEYVRVMTSILPRELLLERGMGEVDDDALDDLLSALHQRLLEAKQQAPLLLSPGVKCDREPSP